MKHLITALSLASFTFAAGIAHAGDAAAAKNEPADATLKVRINGKPATRTDVDRLHAEIMTKISESMSAAKDLAGNPTINVSLDGNADTAIRKQIKEMLDRANEKLAAGIATPGDKETASTTVSGARTRTITIGGDGKKTDTGWVDAAGSAKMPAPNMETLGDAENETSLKSQNGDRTDTGWKTTTTKTKDGSITVKTRVISETSAFEVPSAGK